MSMFGVTTPCVQALTKRLEDRYNCLVFHATGTGGQSMEKLVESGLVNAVIDVTTTEIPDEIVGGVLSADPNLCELRVSGEISGFKRHSSGHLYFSLKDETGVLSCVMFAGHRRGLAFRMKDGDRVVVGGAV